jgi:hypothetical protein
MPTTYTSNWLSVSNGGQTTHDKPASRNVIATEVRWRGLAEQYEDPQEKTRRESHSWTQSINRGMNFADAPSDGNNVRTTSYVVVDPADNSVEYNYTYGYNGGEISGTTTGILYNEEGGRGQGDDVSLTVYTESEADFEGTINGTTRWTITKTRTTESPTTTLNDDGTASVSESVTDGDTTGWVDITGLKTGTNTFDHSIGGSGDAEFQYRYTYSENAAVPTDAPSEPVAASIGGETVTAAPTPAGSEPVAALRDFSNAGPGWLALLETAGGEERRIEATELMSVATNQENTAAWDGTVQLPPIIDPDRYRGGSMQLRYNGALVLRCPELVARDRGNDGSLTIKGLGPAADLKAYPVDREFDGVLVTDAMATLLMTDAGLSRSQVTIFEPPERPVDGEVVQSASNREELAAILSKRSRSSSGRFESEVGGTAPDWQPTDPFEWDGDGGVRTTQTLHFREAEGYANASNATRTAVAGASGGDVVEFGADGTTETEYSVEFGHEVPEGSFGVSIRGKSESITADGTTTIRVRADDRTLVSFPVDDFLTGQGFEWKHVTTDFAPGTEEFTLRVDVTSAGDRRLDMDAIAVYDDRYSYSFDNTTDANDALEGPGLYPDAAPLRFEPAPVGIALDEATTSVTMDAEGAADTVGVAATGGGDSSASSVTGTSDSHTATLEATTPAVRPTVKLSRTSDGRTETPTAGNAPQALTSIETTISGNAIPVIENRSFEATDVFAALQSLCRDYDFNWVIEHGRERGTFSIEVFKRGDPKLRRSLPDSVTVMDYSESATAENYANSVTVIGARIPDGDGERYRWTERDAEEIDAFGEQPATPIENDDLESTNDCRSVARAELAKRLDEDERGGSLDIVPTTVLEPGYPYEIVVWEDNPDAPGWGESWGESWGGVQEEFATLETATFSESSGNTSAGGDFDVRSDLLAALGGN